MKSATSWVISAPIVVGVSRPSVAIRWCCRGVSLHGHRYWPLLCDKPRAEVVVAIGVVGEDADHRVVGLVPDGEAIGVAEHPAVLVAVAPRVVLDGGGVTGF